MNFILGIDVWEGNPNLDEAILKAAGVQFLIIRLNDMNGENHLDANFAAQWAQAQPFIHWPYYVYSPWYSGETNFAWVAAHVPADATALMVDIEVRKDGYSPAEYSKQVGIFLALVTRRWKDMIYTGKWFEAVLATWPKNKEYVYARYPFIVYPDARQHWTWEKLKHVMYNMTWQPGSAPGPCRMWQITGDRLILPGCGETCVDVLAWNGTVETLAAFVGAPVPSPVDWEHSITTWARTVGYQGPEPDNSGVML